MGLFSNKPSRFDLRLEGHVPATNTTDRRAGQQREAAGEAASNAQLAAQNGDSSLAAYYAAQAERARDEYRYPYQR
jgi:hypothetical protein